MMSFYPGDPAVFQGVKLLLAVCLVCSAGLFLSLGFRRNQSGKHSVLCSALICSLLVPAIAVGFWGMGVSLLSVPWLTAEPASPPPDSPEIIDPTVGDPASSLSSLRRPIPDTATRFSDESVRAVSPVKQDVDTLPANPPTPAAVAAPSRWRQAVAVGIVIWLAGSLILLTSVAWSSFRLSRIARNASAFPGNRLRRVAERVESHLSRGKLPTVTLSGQVPGPLACGVFRPMIILPHRLLAQLSDDQLCDVLTHEAAHLVRRDPLVLFLQRIAGSLYWPIPLLHFLNRRLNKTREDICDNHVLIHRDPIDYGETLLRVAELVCLAPRVRGANSMLARTGPLERRITNLLDERRNKMTQTSRGWALTAFSLLLAASALACSVQIGSASAESPVEEKAANPSIESVRIPQFALEENKLIPTNDSKSSPKNNEPAKDQAHRVVFKPMHGMENRSSWTALASFPLEDKTPYEQMMGRLTLLGEIPVQRKDDKEPIFKIKLMAGSDDSLNIRLTGPDKMPYDRILHRDQPLSWKIKGQTYRIVYSTTEVAADQSAESHHAFLFVTCRPEENLDGNDLQETTPPEESKDDSKGDGGSDLLRNIRAATAPILKELAEKHGYGLEQGQFVRHVPLPFPELRMTYYRVGHPHQSEVIRNPPTHMLFHWTEGRLQNWGMAFGGPPDSGQSIGSVVTSVTNNASQEIEIQGDLREQRIAGDWVVRPGESAEKVLPQLEAILRKELNLPIRLEIKKVERPVYVVAGTYKLTPLEGEKARGQLHLTDKTITTDKVHIFGKSFVPNSGAGGGTGSFDEFLKSTGGWISTPIVNEVQQPPSREISWSYHQRSPFTDEMQREDHDPETVLENITKQTNLKFTKEMRPIKILFVSRDR